MFLWYYFYKTATSRDHTGRSDAGKHRIESEYTVLNRRLPGISGPGDFNFLNNRSRLTGTRRAAKQRRLILGHHRSSSGMNRISTVRPLDKTVANRHELCLRWRYGDSRLCYGVSRRRAGAAPTLAGWITIWHGSSRWMPAKLRWSYGMTTVQAGGRRLNYRNSI